MGRLPLGMLALAALGPGVFASRGIAAQEADAAPELRIDRWLVSDPIALDSIDDSGEAKLLSGSGEFGVLPRRGEDLAGVRWTLLRTDSPQPLRLDSLDEYIVEPTAGEAFATARDSIRPPYATFAHAYVRAPEDRNVVLQWQTESCSLMDLRLNGSRVYGTVGVSGHGPGGWAQSLSAEIRLAAGWNTLLARVQVPEPGDNAPADCGSIDVRIGAASEGTLEGIRVQGSRPPGQVRTGPEPWVVMSRYSFPIPTWQSNRVTMNVPVVLTAYGRSVLDSVRVRIRGPDTDLRTTLRDLHVGQPDTLKLRFPFDQLAALAKPGSIRVETRWKDQKIEERLTVPSAKLEDPLTHFLKLEGWVPGGPDALVDGTAELMRKVPNESGMSVRGEWTVPSELSGRSLMLQTVMAPADYRINGEAAPDGAAPSIILCENCTAGSSIEIAAVSTAAWTDFPLVSVQ